MRLPLRTPRDPGQGWPAVCSQGAGDQCPQKDGRLRRGDEFPSRLFVPIAHEEDIGLASCAVAHSAKTPRCPTGSFFARSWCLLPCEVSSAGSKGFHRSRLSGCRATRYPRARDRYIRR